MRGEFVLYINHSGKYIEINFNMKIPFLENVIEYLKDFFLNNVKVLFLSLLVMMLNVIVLLVSRLSFFVLHS